MNISEELKLVENAKSNAQSFDTLYDLYFPKIYMYCYQRLLIKEITEDVVSEVFESAIKGIAKFDTTKGITFLAWLYRVAHNKCVDQLRNKKRVFKEIDENLKDNTVSLERELSLNLLQMQVAIILKDQKDKYQQVISLRFFMEMEIPEIAEVMNQKPQNVSVILHRALSDFRKKFIKKFPQSEIFELI